MSVDSNGNSSGSDREKISRFAPILTELREQLGHRIVGQDRVVTLVLAAILAEGHCLLVGVPGLAKTLIVSTVAELLSVGFKRIQFTPDLMPTDITGGTMIHEDDAGVRDFHIQRGPIFTNVLLADEINRTPPKTQASLMEAMEERQVSMGGKQLALERPFFVLATQNPIEQEGTYPLPVSQLDRFLFNIEIDYPSAGEEYRIVVQTTSTYGESLEAVLEQEALLELIALVKRVVVSDQLLKYASRIVRWTRPDSPGAPDFVREYLAWGAGPRATQAILSAARAMAVLGGRDQVSADDIHAVVLPTLRHRVLLKYHAQAEGVAKDDVLVRLLRALPDGLFHEPAEDTSAPPGLLARLFG